MATKTIFNFVLILALTLSLIALSSASLVYNNTAQYSPSAHTYTISASVVDYVTASVKGTSSDDCAYAIFSYLDGSTSSTTCQKVPYISWVSYTYVNPNPSLQVTSITIKGGTHTYMKDFFAYTGSAGIPNIQGTQLATYCGDGKVNGTEQCDLGEMNGVLCSAGYNSFCDYCSSQCQIKTLKGEFCGDGMLNLTYERCDDGNRIDGDRCNNECKKPFEVITEDFVPQVWECDSRVVYDDATQPGRISQDGQTLVERVNDYAFEGEQIQWKVLLMDKNGIEKVGDVYVTVDGEMQANCKLLHDNTYQFPGEIDSITSVTDGIGIDPSCNARIDEEQLTEFNPSTMAYYLCTLTVETSDSMQGESDVTVEVTDIDGEVGVMAEMERWFLNPTIELSVDGTIEFDNMRPGTSSYSDRVLIGNGAEYGSGVMLDMFISGTDFYDSSNSGALCPTTNQLSLSNFRYYVTNGAYSSHTDPRSDVEGYNPIRYGIGFNDPKPFYNQNEILQAQKVGPYYTANILAPGSEMSLIFRLNLPEGCNGDFDTGKIYFWGEAI